MGTTALRALFGLRQKRPDVEVKVLGAVEPKENQQRNIRNLSRLTGVDVEIFDTLPEVLGFQRCMFDKMGESGSVIIYDASPPVAHFGYLSDIRRRANIRTEKYVYLGEKPLFIDPFDVRIVSDSFPPEFHFFCDFIESQNPVFIKVREYVETESLDIYDIKLWRAGCAGLTHLVGDEREGVQGGALLDKSGHDLGITVGLLGLEEIRGYEILGVPNICCFMPFDANCLEVGHAPSFKSVIGKQSKKIMRDTHFSRQELIADAAVAMRVQWNTRFGVVTSKYLFSWIGRTGDPQEREVIQELASLGFPEETWLDSQGEVTSTSGKFNYNLEDIRVGIISCRNEKNHRDVKIVCNFVGKRSLQRYAVALEGKKLERHMIFEEPKKVYLEAKGEDLSGILSEVVDATLGAQSSRSELIRAESYAART